MNELIDATLNMSVVPDVWERRQYPPPQKKNTSDPTRLPVSISENKDPSAA